MAAVTRLGLYGGPRGLYGSFAGRTTNIVVATAAGAGSSKRKRQRRYPRWVMVDGERYQVWSPDEERSLLRALHDRARDQIIKLEGMGKPVAAIKRRAVRIERRIAETDSSEALWLQRLRDEDEEILLMVD